MQGAIASIADSSSRIPGCSFFISFFLVNDSDKNLPLSGFKYLAEESKCSMMGNAGAGSGIGWWGSDQDTWNVGGEYAGIFRVSFTTGTMAVALCTDATTVMDERKVFDWCQRVINLTGGSSNYYTTLTPDNDVAAVDREIWADWSGDANWSAFSAQPEIILPPTVTAGSGQIVVDEPPVATHGSAVTQWDIRYRSVSDVSHAQGSEIYSETEDQVEAHNTGGWSGTTNITWTSNQYTITGLSAGNYRVQVRAHNANGTGPWSTNNLIEVKDSGTPRAVAVGVS